MRNPVGTGPFKFVSGAPTTLKVEKNDDYWRKGYRRSTRHLRSVPDNSARVAMMQTGEAHFTFPVPYEW